MIKRFLIGAIALMIIIVIGLGWYSYRFFSNHIGTIGDMFQTYQYNLAMQQQRDLLVLINQVVEKRYRDLQEQSLAKEINYIRANIEALNQLLNLQSQIKKRVLDSFLLNGQFQGYVIKDGIIISSSDIMEVAKGSIPPCNPKVDGLNECEIFKDNRYFFVKYNPKYDLYLIGWTYKVVDRNYLKSQIVSLLRSFPGIIVGPKEVVARQPNGVYRIFRPFNIYYGMQLNKTDIHQLVENALTPIRNYLQSLFFRYGLISVGIMIVIALTMMAILLPRANRLEYLWKETEIRALRDHLTGLYNRNGFKKVYEEEVEGECSLVLVDVDNFKYINDTFGHDRGDEILTEIARMLNREFCNSLVGRWGGDEFIICTKLPKDEIKRKIYHLQREIKEFQQKFDEKMEKTISFSVGACQDHQLSYPEKFKKADLALYKAKKKGKGLVLFYRELDYIRMEKEDLV